MNISSMVNNPTTRQDFFKELIFEKKRIKLDLFFAVRKMFFIDNQSFLDLGIINTHELVSYISKIYLLLNKKSIQITYTPLSDETLPYGPVEILHSFLKDLGFIVEKNDNLLTITLSLPQSFI